MKVFISWSGTASQKLARELKGWLPKVVQAAEIFMSDADIEKGERWLDKLTTELESGQFGIVCLTPDNKDAAWLHFEAGAISKAIKGARVAPLLFDLTPSDIRGPLSSFQITSYRKDEMRKLLASISAASDKPLPPEALTDIFEAMWRGLEDKVDAVLKEHRAQWGDLSAVTRKPDLGRVEATVEEILALVRKIKQEEVPAVSGVWERDERLRRDIFYLKHTHHAIARKLAWAVKNVKALTQDAVVMDELEAAALEVAGLDRQIEALDFDYCEMSVELVRTLPRERRTSKPAD